ncbi:MAG: asparagine synthase (glutamine-hydrolyzing) [Candidatus Acidiferrum sp.]
MCGIAGMFNLDGAPVAPEDLRGTIRMLAHRGPDDTGFHLESGVGLAHARLSIIDLACGHQPMSNEDSSLWITFNGEIFNYLELREILLSKGHKFATHSDTEVLLHLYEEKGDDCVQYLNGQWAFAIWDNRRRRLFLSRDRLGVRPLFYTQAKKTFLFGSEIKAIFAHPGVAREIDFHGLDEVFTYWCTIPPTTLFRNIHELPPGHSMTVDSEGIAIRSYWDYQFEKTSGAVAPCQEQAYADQLLDLLVSATQMRLRADVPVGAYLSGGLDSTVTTALVKRFTNAKLRTFSISFDDAEFDESSFQNEAVRFLDTEHQDIRCSKNQIGEVFPDVIWHTEKPVLRTAPAPLYLLSRLVRNSGYKVVVTGEGSDEVLGGYDIFKENKIRRFWESQPNSRMRPALLRRLYPYLRNIQNQPDAYRKAFFHINVDPHLQPFFSHIPRWQLTAKLKTFFSDAVRTEIGEDNGYSKVRSGLPRSYASWDNFCQAQYLETKYLLPGYILSSQGDRVAMAHSVEGRFPFLDHRVVEFASRLPVSLKMKVLNEKYLLKRCAVGLIPTSVAKRPKQPYRAPEACSFLQPAAREYMEELLSPEQIRRDGIFDGQAVAMLHDKFRKGAAIGIKDNMGLVGIVSTQLLIHQFINHFESRTTSHGA